MKKVLSLSDFQNTPAGRLASNAHLFEKEKKKRKPRKPTKQVQWVENELRQWCEKQGFELIPEFRFNPYRKWRTDWYIKELNLCLEYEGIMSEKSRHTSRIGYSKDLEKYNSITELGFKLLRFTVLNYLNIINQIEKLAV